MRTLERALRRVSTAGCRPHSAGFGTVISRTLVLPESADIGIHTWGAIDYLARCHDYHVMRERS